MAIKIVKEFTFPSENGFTGSAGQTHVKGYARGGSSKPRAAKKPHAVKVSAPRHFKARQGPALPPPMPPPPDLPVGLGALGVAPSPAALGQGPLPGGMPPGGALPVDPTMLNARNGGRARKR